MPPRFNPGSCSGSKASSSTSNTQTSSATPLSSSSQIASTSQPIAPKTWPNDTWPHPDTLAHFSTEDLSKYTQWFNDVTRIDWRLKHLGETQNLTRLQEWAILDQELKTGNSNKRSITSRHSHTMNWMRTILNAHPPPGKSSWNSDFPRRKTKDNHKASVKSTTQQEGGEKMSTKSHCKEPSTAENMEPAEREEQIAAHGGEKSSQATCKSNHDKETSEETIVNEVETREPEELAISQADANANADTNATGNTGTRKQAGHDNEGVEAEPIQSQEGECSTDASEQPTAPPTEPGRKREQTSLEEAESGSKRLCTEESIMGHSDGNNPTSNASVNKSDWDAFAQPLDAALPPPFSNGYRTPAEYIELLRVEQAEAEAAAKAEAKKKQKNTRKGRKTAEEENREQDSARTSNGDRRAIVEAPVITKDIKQPGGSGCKYWGCNDPDYQRWLNSKEPLPGPQNPLPQPPQMPSLQEALQQDPRGWGPTAPTPEEFLGREIPHPLAPPPMPKSDHSEEYLIGALLGAGYGQDHFPADMPSDMIAGYNRAKFRGMLD